MKLSISAVRKLCEEAGARQVVAIAIDRAGHFQVTSYGETKAECRSLVSLCDAIADGLRDGTLPEPT